MYEQRKHRDAFKAFPELREALEAGERETERGSLATHRAEAAALGRSFDRLRQPINVVDELRKLRFVEAQEQLGPMLEATWRLLSGYEYGLGWALPNGSHRQIEAEIPGGVTVHLVINDEAFVNAAKSAYFLLIAACRLLTRRHLEPS